MRNSLKTAALYAFVISGQIAAVLNSIAAALSTRDGGWGRGLGYLAIALMLSFLTLVAWWSASRQRPYHWRDGSPRRPD